MNDDVQALSDLNYCNFYFSSAQKVWIALEASGATYDMEEISLYGPGGKPGWFLKLNPKGTVPVLVCHGGTMTMGDSDEILDRFSEGVAEGSKLVPSGEKEEQIMKGFRSKLNEFLPIGKKAILGGGKDKMWDPLAEIDSMILGPYVCGDEVTVADCAAFPFLWRIENEFGCMKEEGYKKIKKWLQTCEENKAFSKTIQQSWWWWW